MPVACFCVATALWYRSGRFLAQGDLFFNYDALNFLAKTASTWATARSPFGGFGFPTYSVYHLLTGAAQLLVGQGLAQVAIVAAAFSSAILGLYALALRLGVSRFGAIFAAAAYAFSPLAQFLVTFVSGMLFFAVLPWVLFSLLLVLQARDAKAQLLFVAVALFGVSMVGSTPQLLFALVIVSLLWCAFWLVKMKSRPAVLAFGSAVGSAMIVSLWWLVPVLLALFTSHIARPTDEQAYATVFSQSSLLNMLRFVSQWTWSLGAYYPYAPQYDGNPLVYGATVAFPILAIGSMVLARGRMLNVARGAILVAAICMFFGKGTHEPFPFINDVFYKIPGMFLFLEPAGLEIVALLFVAIAIGIFVEAALSKLPNRRASLAWAGVIVAIAFGLQSWPLFSGSMFREQAPSWASFPSMYVRVPNSWTALRSFMEKRPAADGVVQFPRNDDYQADYEWGYHGVDLVAMSMLPQSILITGSAVNYTDDLRIHAIGDRLAGTLFSAPASLSAAMRHLGLRYVLVRGDVRPSMHLPFTPEQYALALSRACQNPCELHRFGKLLLADFGSPGWLFAESPRWLQERGTDLPPDVALSLLSVSGPISRTLDRRSKPAITTEREVTQGPTNDSRTLSWIGADAPSNVALPGHQLGGRVDQIPVEHILQHSPGSGPPNALTYTALVSFVKASLDSGVHLFAFNPSYRKARGAVMLESGGVRLHIATVTLGPGFTDLGTCRLDRSGCDEFASAPSPNAIFVFERGAPANASSTLPHVTSGVSILTPSNSLVFTPEIWSGGVPFSEDPLISVSFSNIKSAHGGLMVFFRHHSATFGCFVDSSYALFVRDAVAPCLSANGLSDVLDSSLVGLSAVFSLPLGWGSALIDPTVTDLAIASRKTAVIGQSNAASILLEPTDRSFRVGNFVEYSTPSLRGWGKIAARSTSGMEIVDDGGVMQPVLYDQMTNASILQRATYTMKAPAGCDRLALQFSTAVHIDRLILRGTTFPERADSWTPDRAIVIPCVLVPPDGLQLSVLFHAGAAPVLDSLAEFDAYNASGNFQIAANQQLFGSTLMYSDLRKPDGEMKQLSSNGSTWGISFAGAQPGLLVFNQLFDPSWMAIRFGAAPRILPHMQVDGFRNGWIVDRSGSVYVFNLVCLLQLVDITATLLLIVGLTWKTFVEQRRYAL